MADDDPKRDLLRHTLATLAYRGGKALRGAPGGFGDFLAAEGIRTPGQILGHIADLLDWALSMAMSEPKWRDSRFLGWDDEVQRFFVSLGLFDTYLASGQPLGCPAERLFQGPIADAFTHVGQISMLRRLAGSPVRGENYFQAKITTGQVGVDQTPPVREF